MSAPLATESRAPVLVLWIALPLLIAGLMAWYLVQSRQAAGEFGFPLDDSWIHVRFAQNLAHGHGFSFNPGVPTGLTTSVLWTFLLAAVYRVTHEYLFTSMVVNWVLCSLLCALVHQLALALHPSRWLALTAAALVAVTAPLPWWALSGMEPPLYAVLSLLAVLLHLRRGEVRGWRALLPTVVMALAGLARPELFLLFPLALLDRLVMASRAREAGWLKREARDVLGHGLLFAALIAPAFVYDYRVTGYLLPTSFYSKLQQDTLAQALAGGSWSHVLTIPWNEGVALLTMWGKNNVLLVIAFFPGLYVLVRQALRSERPHRSLLIALVLLLQPLLWAWLGGFRDPAFQSQRYVANLNALFVLVGVLGAAWAMDRVAVLRGLAARRALVVVAIGVSLAGQAETARTYALNVKNITEMQVNLGRWLRTNVPHGSRLALNDVGAIGVLADDPVVDLQGLVTPEALAAHNRGLAQYLAHQMPTAMLDFVIANRPEYLVIFPQWYPEMDTRRDLFTPVYGVQLQDNITAGAPTMVVYRTVWARRGRQ